MTEEEFNELRPSAFAIAYRMLGSVSEAEDVVQEGFTSEQNARQLAARARRHVDERRPRFDTSREQRDQLAIHFFAAAEQGDLQGLEQLLAHDVQLTGDGGGKVPALARSLYGPNRGEMSSGVVAASPRAAVKDSARLPVRVAYGALAWVVVFFAFHVYWFLGGSFGLSGELPSLVPDSVAGWIFEVLEAAVWPLGAWVCLAIARGWPRGRVRRAALIVVWLGCAVLVVRGGAGLIDDLTRAVGLLPNGITGLSHKQTMGAAYYRSASALWSGNVIDAYFLAGGIIFGLLGCRYRLSRSPTRH